MGTLTKHNTTIMDISFVSPIDTDRRKPALRETVCENLGHVYVIGLAIITTVLSLTHFVSPFASHSGVCVLVIFTYLFGGSILFILYMQICFSCRQRRYNNSHRGEINNEDDDVGSFILIDKHSHSFAIPSSPKLRKIIRSSVIQEHVESNYDTIPHDKEPKSLEKPVMTSSMAMDGPESVKDLKQNEATESNGFLENNEDDGADVDLAFSFEGEGVSLVLRLAIIILGVGSTILCAFRLLEFAETDPKMPCYSRLFLIQTALHILFIIYQTFFIFKYHKLVISFQPMFMWFGFLHLMVTNIAVCIYTIVHQIADTHAHMVLSKETDDLSSISGICHNDPTQADKAAPYLFPLTVQWCFISAAVVFRIYNQVEENNSQVNPGWRLARPMGALCHGAHVGIAFGCFLIVIGMISAFFCYLGDESTLIENHISRLICSSGYLFIVFSAFIMTIFAFVRVKQIGAGPAKRDFHMRLLLIGIGGYYALQSLIAGPLVDMVIHLDEEDEVIKEMPKFLDLATCFFAFIQATMQIPLIAYGWRMMASGRAQLQNKPGRSSITVLILSNFAIWIIISLKLAEIFTNEDYRSFYGSVTWNALIHIFLPVSCLFRLLSGICLTAIWIKAYRPHVRVSVGMEPKISTIHSGSN